MCLEAAGRQESLHFCNLQAEGGNDMNVDDSTSSHPWLKGCIEILENKKVSRQLADLDVITQDRASFVSNWSKLLDVAIKFKSSCTVLDKKRMEVATCFTVRQHFSYNMFLSC